MLQRARAACRDPVRYGATGARILQRARDLESGILHRVVVRRVGVGAGVEEDGVARRRADDHPVPGPDRTHVLPGDLKRLLVDTLRDERTGWSAHDLIADVRRRIERRIVELRRGPPGAAIVDGEGQDVPQHHRRILAPRRGAGSVVLDLGAVDMRRYLRHLGVHLPVVGQLCVQCRDSVEAIARVAVRDIEGGLRRRPGAVLVGQLVLVASGVHRAAGVPRDRDLSDPRLEQVPDRAVGQPDHEMQIFVAGSAGRDVRHDPAHACLADHEPPWARGRAEVDGRALLVERPS